MSKWLCMKINANTQTSEYENSQSSSDSTIPSSFISDLDKLNLTKKRLKRYADEVNIGSNTSFSDAATLNETENDDTMLRTKAKFLREKAVSQALNNIKRSMDVDLCFVLDCTGSMSSHIAAAKDCILQVSNKCKSINPNIKLRIGFCGYRDHYNDSNRLQLFDFTDKYEKFTKFLQGVSAISNDDDPEDVLGGLNAAITQLSWRNGTRVLFHIGDYPP
ncbi:hypothetical protein C1645_864608, partial [Glomus cerebriforme]